MIQSINDMAQHTIRFLRGEIPQSPNHLGPIADETKPYVDALVKINELGFVTTDSQPGGRGRSQRSYLTGLCSRATAESLYRLNQSDLVVMVYDVYSQHTPNVDCPARLSGGVPVTIDDGKPFTFVGHYMNDFEHWNLSWTFAKANELCEVTLIDPDWNRDPLTLDGLFWRACQALR